MDLVFSCCLVKRVDGMGSARAVSYSFAGSIKTTAVAVDLHDRLQFRQHTLPVCLAEAVQLGNATAPSQQFDIPLHGPAAFVADRFDTVLDGVISHE
jgi:hypothetical protein